MKDPRGRLERWAAAHPYLAWAAALYLVYLLFALLLLPPALVDGWFRH